jgi:hypothetical protein
MTRPTRRALLLAGGGLAAVLAGCLGGDDGGGDATTGAERTPAAGATDDTGTRTATTEGPAATVGTPADAGAASATAAGTGLDLREANVTGVAVESVGDGVYEFAVTLHHDDDGEAGYANWWQVETLDGDRLGRRELLHAHGTRAFTRSATVSVPDGGCVVVRGHDETHGYGGRATTVNVGTGATRAVEQGSERRSLSAADCP